MIFRPWGRVETRIPCPDCGAERLLAVRSCARSYCHCEACDRRFTVAELAPRLSDEQFERLAEAVGEHLSNRV
jgi:hypothetical protein